MLMRDYTFLLSLIRLIDRSVRSVIGGALELLAEEFASPLLFLFWASHVQARKIYTFICILKGSSTLKNMLPKINIYDKWIYVSVIKLTVTIQIRYRRILTIKLLISRNVFLHGSGSSKPSSLFLYPCLFVDVDVVTKNSCSYVISCVKTCVVSTI